jgi:hypothetical protein
MSSNKVTRRNARTGCFVLGRESFSKISAVEGLVMSRSMRGEFQALDRQNASAPKRRKTLSGKYGK